MINCSRELKTRRMKVNVCTYSFVLLSSPAQQCLSKIERERRGSTSYLFFGLCDCVQMFPLSFKFSSSNFKKHSLNTVHCFDTSTIPASTLCGTVRNLFHSANSQQRLVALGGLNFF